MGDAGDVVFPAGIELCAGVAADEAFAAGAVSAGSAVVGRGEDGFGEGAAYLDGWNGVEKTVSEKKDVFIKKKQKKRRYCLCV